MPEIIYGQVADFLVEKERAIENGDIRITENDDIRVTNSEVLNIVTTSIIISGSVIPFNVIPYVKVSGNWKQVLEIKVKYNSSWVTPISAHKNENGIWKRIY